MPIAYLWPQKYPVFNLFVGPRVHVFHEWYANFYSWIMNDSVQLRLNGCSSTTFNCRITIHNQSSMPSNTIAIPNKLMNLNVIHTGGQKPDINALLKAHGS